MTLVGGANQRLTAGEHRPDVVQRNDALFENVTRELDVAPVSTSTLNYDGVTTGKGFMDIHNITDWYSEPRRWFESNIRHLSTKLCVNVVQTIRFADHPNVLTPRLLFSDVSEWKPGGTVVARKVDASGTSTPLICKLVADKIVRMSVDDTTARMAFRYFVTFIAVPYMTYQFTANYRYYPIESNSRDGVLSYRFAVETATVLSFAAINTLSLPPPDSGEFLV